MFKVYLKLLKVSSIMLFVKKSRLLYNEMRKDWGIMSFLSTTNVSSEFLRDTILDRLSLNNDETSIERLRRLVNRSDEEQKTSVDNSVIKNLNDGKYEISLRQYTDLNNYNAAMISVFGNKSANNFRNYINNILNKNDEDKTFTAKDMINNLKEQGLSEKDALKLYSALHKYSLINSYKNYNFISAKI